MEEESINAYGRASLSDDPNPNFDRIDKNTQNAIDNNFKEQDIEIKASALQNKIQAEKENRAFKLRQLADKAEDRRLKEKQIDATIQNSFINKN